MKRLCACLARSAARWILGLGMVLPCPAAGDELRGTWLARDSLSSREQLAQAMDLLAAARFNTVYVNCWSRGYPLWKSRVFQQETGILSDPGYGSRDVLAEAVLEGHRAGLLVEAWFEYGFCGGWDQYYPGRSGKGPLFDAHPDWLAKSRSGADLFASGSLNFFWMAHVHPGPRKLLLDLVREVVQGYDIDGIEFDRARYPQTDCGYDETTRQVYKKEKGGQEPPADPNQADWMRWRADRLSLWVGDLYRAVKALRPELSVSNAPVTTPYGYVNFLQDYPAWLRDGSLDLAAPQIYRRTASDYRSELQRQMAAVGNRWQLFPGIDSVNPAREDFLSMIQETRQAGLRGLVLWYAESLRSRDLLSALREGPFAEPAEVPDRPAGWKRNRILAEENSPEALPEGSWQAAAGGWQGNRVCAGGGVPARMVYRLTAPRTGWYQASAFTTPQPGTPGQAAYALQDHLGRSALRTIDQQSSGSERWQPLGFLYLQAGQPLDAVTLRNANPSEESRVCADAVLLLESHWAPWSDSVSFRLQGPSSRSIALDPWEAGLQTGYASLTLRQGVALLGMAVFRSVPGHTPSAGVVSAAAVAAAPPLRRALLPAEVSSRSRTGLALTNPGASPAGIRLQLRHADGAVLEKPAAVALQLAPGEQRARFLDDWFAGLPGDFLGLLEVQSSAEIGCLTLRGGWDERGEFTMTTMPLLDPEAAADQEPLILPHLADGGGYWTELWLINRTAAPIEGTVRFYDSLGHPLSLAWNGETREARPYRLAGYALERLVSRGDGLAVRTGFAVLSPAGGSAAVSGSGVFSFRQPGGARTEAGVPCTAARLGAWIPVRQGEQDGTRQVPGMAVANPGTVPARLQLTLYDRTGMILAGPQAAELAPFEQRARFLEEWLGVGPLSCEGLLHIRSDVPVAVLGLDGYLNPNGDFVMSALAAEPAPKATRLLLPYLASGGDYRCDTILAAPEGQPSEGTLGLKKADGRPWVIALP